MEHQLLEIPVRVLENVRVGFGHPPHPASLHVDIALGDEVAAHEGHGRGTLPVLDRGPRDHLVGGPPDQVSSVIDTRGRSPAALPGTPLLPLFAFTGPEQDGDAHVRVPVRPVGQRPVRDPFRHEQGAGGIGRELPAAEHVLDVRPQVLRVAAVSPDVQDDLVVLPHHLLQAGIGLGHPPHPAELHVVADIGYQVAAHVDQGRVRPVLHAGIGLLHRGRLFDHIPFIVIDRHDGSLPTLPVSGSGRRPCLRCFFLTMPAL